MRSASRSGVGRSRVQCRAGDARLAFVVDGVESHFTPGRVPIASARSRDFLRRHDHADDALRIVEVAQERHGTS
jgi:hypothetical protein